MPAPGDNNKDPWLSLPTDRPPPQLQGASYEGWLANPTCWNCGGMPAAVPSLAKGEIHKVAGRASLVCIMALREWPRPAPDRLCGKEAAILVYKQDLHIAGLAGRSAVRGFLAFRVHVHCLLMEL